MIDINEILNDYTYDSPEEEEIYEGGPDFEHEPLTDYADKHGK